MDIHREVRLLKLYILASSLLFGFLLLEGFAQAQQRQRFDEIDVGRINIVETSGKIRMTISNRDRAPDPLVSGQTVKRQGGNPPGIIFFNDDGDERGGLVYSNGNASLTFDKYRQPELLRLAYSEDGQGSEGGLVVLDRPNQPPTVEEMAQMAAQESTRRSLPAAERQAVLNKLMDEAAAKGETLGGSLRVFAGKMRDRSAVVVLGDAVGRPRLRLSVAPQGDASIEFLDRSGKVIQRLPTKH